MMILSILATVVLLGALFYHRVSLFISSLILLAWTAALGVAGLWSAWGTGASGHYPRAI
ncbi:acyl-CoA dehydrogenase [Escherichia coli]|uniref:Acyl-CoA dehydrogenase n=1 Tax=Escherichia coli TaxID=562 RepID=A0A2X3JQ21_ECOLX|nr:acyl-CoA dehydrogenase [Escherichia coli]